jgi:protein TonB
MRRKISDNWLKYQLDPGIAAGRRVYVEFEITRSGSPTNVHIGQSSGVPSLDISAVRAMQRIDTFGGLPPGYGADRVNVEFWFEK